MRPCGDPNCRCHIRERGLNQGWRFGAVVAETVSDERRREENTRRKREERARART